MSDADFRDHIKAIVGPLPKADKLCVRKPTDHGYNWPPVRIFDVTSKTGATMHVEANGTEDAMIIAQKAGLDVDVTTIRESPKEAA
jgi:hypothetical protein